MYMCLYLWRRACMAAPKSARASRATRIQSARATASAPPRTLRPHETQQFTRTP